VMHKKPVIVRELKRIAPTTRIRIFTKIFRSSSFKSFYNFGIKKGNILTLKTKYGIAFKKPNGCWRY